MRWILLITALLHLVDAQAETNLCWASSNSWQLCQGPVWSRANVNPATDYSGGTFRDFAAVPAAEAVYVCQADRSIGATDGCPSPGNYSQERWVLKSSLVVAPPPPDPPPPPVFTGTGLLTWDAPTANADGSPLTNLTGYRVYWSLTLGTYLNSATILPGVTSYLVEGLAPGTWYFVVTAISATGGESVYSNVASKVIDGDAPVDCVVSAWAQGPLVPATCPVSGTQTRTDTRTVLTAPANGGADCPALTQMVDVTCTLPPAPVARVVAVLPGLSHSPVFGVSSTNTRQTTVLGFAPVGADCTGPVVYTYRGQGYRRIASGVVWWQSTATTNAAAACQ